MAARRSAKLAAVPPESARRHADDLLNRTVCIDIESFGDTLAGATEQAAKLARVLNLALIGLIHQERYTGSKHGDLELLQELAYGVEYNADAAEVLQGRHKDVGDSIAARRRVGGGA